MSFRLSICVSTSLCNILLHPRPVVKFMNKNWNFGALWFLANNLTFAFSLYSKVVLCPYSQKSHQQHNICTHLPKLEITNFILHFEFQY